MASHTILFPTDLSPANEALLPVAVDQARERHATLLLLHVAEPALSFGMGEVLPGAAADRSDLADSLNDLMRPWADVPCMSRVAVGDAAREIVATAVGEQVEMIVMGTHGRTGLERLLGGSVAEAVVRHAPCPVLTIRYPWGRSRTSATPLLESVW